MKKIILLLLATLFFVACEKQHAADAPIKIGAILELTGNLSQVGEFSKNAAEMAVKEVNEQGGLVVNGKKRPVVLLVEDYGAVPDRAATVTENLIKQKQVLAIVGPNASIGAIAAADVAENEKVVLITPWSTASATTFNAKTSGYKQYVFRMGFADIFEVKVLANFARFTKNYKTAAILYDAEAKEPANQAAMFKQAFEKLGGKIVSFQSYKSDSTKDFLTAPLEAIKAANPDVLFLPDYYHRIGVIAQQLKQLGIRAELLGSDNWNRPELIAASQGALEGAYFSAHYSPDDNSAVTQAFVAQYRKRYGKVPDDVAALTYDAYHILFKAIAMTKTLNSEAVRNSLWALPMMEGVTGTFNFEKKMGGEPSKSAVIMQIKGNKLIWVTHANP